MGKDGAKTILSIGAFFLGAGGWNPFGLGAIGASGGLMGGLMGMSLMNTIWAATHKPEQPSYDNASRFDQMMNNVSSESMITVIYGRRKWAGNQLYHKASSDGRSLTKDVLVGEGECDSISDVKFNDIALPIGGCSYVFHNGSVTQAPPDNFDVVGGYRRMAWIRANMTISEQLQGNNPTVTYVVKGLKVMDTRTNTVAWSDNNAMCVRDFLLSKRYGISKFVHGMTLDEQSFKEAADYCDQLVNYYDANGVLQQEKRYTLNIILDQKRKANEHLDAILATFGGFLVNNNGVISLRIEKPETSAYHFTNDTIIENSVNVEQLSLDESPNQYKIGYFDETQNWTQVKALVNDIIDQQLPPVGKGKVVTKELTLDGCISQSQALRLGRLYKLKNKLCSLTMTFKTSTFAMHLQCGDVVTMTYDKVDDDGAVFSVFVDKPWRIIEISEQDGVYTVKAREYNESIYGDITEVLQVKSYVPLPNPLSDEIPMPTNVTLEEYGWMNRDGTHVSNIDIKWDEVDYRFFERYIVSISENNVDFVTINNTLSNSYRAMGLKVDTKYYIRVQTRNSVGRLSNSENHSITIVGKDNPPKDVTKLTVIQAGEVLVATIATEEEPDIAFYEVRQGDSWESSVLVDKPTGLKSTFEAGQEGTQTYWVKAVDNFGNYSTNAVSHTLSVFGLKPKNVVYDSVDNLSDILSYHNMQRKNNVWSMIERRTIGDNAFFADIFSAGNVTTGFRADPWIVTKPIDLGGNIIEGGIYYIDPWGVTKIGTVENIGDSAFFADIFATPTTPVDVKYLTETFLDITAKYNVSLNTRVDIYYRTSINGISYGDWIPKETSRQFFGRYVQFKLVPVSLDGKTNVYISELRRTVDVPDVENIIDAREIPVETTHIAYPRNFFAMPTSWAVFVEDTTGMSCNYRITNMNEQGFDLELLSSTGTLIAGKLTQGRIRGY